MYIEVFIPEVRPAEITAQGQHAGSERLVYNRAVHTHVSHGPRTAKPFGQRIVQQETVVGICKTSRFYEGVENVVWVVYTISAVTVVQERDTFLKRQLWLNLFTNGKIALKEC